MRDTRDTFLHYLKDNLDPSIPVHNVRRDPNNPSAESIRTNSINVQFLGVSPSQTTGTTQVEIAVCHDTEITCLSWVKSLFDILCAQYMAPKFDYTDPSNPVATGTNIFWRVQDVVFRPINREHYFDYRCTLTLTHKVDS